MKKYNQKQLGLAVAALLVGTLGLGNAALAQTGSALKPMYLAAAPMRTAMPHFTLKKHLSCKAWGSPAEFPHSVLLTNDGTTAIAAGTRVHYVTKGGRRYGDYTFTKTLAHGAHVYAPLSGDTAAGVPCTVTFQVPLPRAQRPSSMTMSTDRQINKNVFRNMLHATCRTGGTGEFVNKAVLTNDRSVVIPTGTRIHYAVNNKVQGNYTFAAPLNSHQGVVIKLSRYTASGLPCSVAFLK